MIAFSGLDGAGKSTQIDLLRKKFLNERKSVFVFWSRGGYTPGMLFFKKSRRLGAFITITLLLAVFPANIYLYLSDTPRDIMNISKNQALLRLPFQVPLIIIAYWHSLDKSSKKFSFFCSVLFIPTIIYFISL